MYASFKLVALSDVSVWSLIVIIHCITPGFSFRNHEWFRKDLPIYLFPSSKLESDVIDQECLTQVCEVGISYSL